MAPFDVESPLAAGLGFAGSYMAGQQQKQKDLQAFKQQQLDNARLASQLALEQQTGSQNATTFAQGQKKVQDQQQLAAWDAANPQPAFSDTQAMSKWAAQRATKARSLGLSDEAKDTATDYRTGQQAQEYGANAAYTSGAKTNATNAGTDLTKARTTFEQAHAQNEKGRFAHEMQMLSAREQAQVQQASMRIGAMLQAAQMRSSTEYGVAQMNNASREGIANMNDGTRQAIANRAALISLHNHDEASSLQIALSQYKAQEQAALQQYKGQQQAYDKNLASFNAGNTTPEGFNPANMPQMPQMPAMPPVNVSVQGGGGDPMVEALLASWLASQQHQAPGVPPEPNPPKPPKKLGTKPPPAPAPQAADIPRLASAMATSLQQGQSEQSVAAHYAAHFSKQDIAHALALAKASSQKPGGAPASGGNPFTNVMHSMHVPGF